MKPETTPEAQLRAMRHIVVSVEPSAAAAQRRFRTIDALRAKQAKLVATREIGRSWRRRALLLAAACLVAMCAAAAVLQNPAAKRTAAVLPALPQLSALAGTIAVDRDGAKASEPVPSDRALALAPNDRVRSAAAARALLAFPSGAAVEVAEDTDFRTGPPSTSSEQVDLALGRVDVRVPKLAAGRQFLVSTPSATVRVHGTRFWVMVTRDVIAGFVTRVGVSEGTVGVERDGRTVELQSGDSWSSAQETQRPVAEVTTERGSGSEWKLARRRSAPRPAERSSRADADQASPSTLTAENALLARALAAVRAGDDERAVRLLESLLEAYPRSTLAPNAKVERFRALRRLGKGREAAVQARRYLDEYPGGMADDEARQIAEPPAQRRR